MFRDRRIVLAYFAVSMRATAKDAKVAKERCSIQSRRDTMAACKWRHPLSSIGCTRDCRPDSVPTPNASAMLKSDAVDRRGTIPR